MKLLRRMTCRIVGHDFVFQAESGRGEPEDGMLQIAGMLLPVRVFDVHVKEVCTRCQSARLVKMRDIQPSPR